VVQCPQQVLIKRTGSFFEPNLNTVRQNFILAVDILLLDSIIEFGVIFFQYEHRLPSSRLLANAKAVD
jgi:hypothetical protein